MSNDPILAGEYCTARIINVVFVVVVIDRVLDLVILKSKNLDTPCFEVKTFISTFDKWWVYLGNFSTEKEGVHCFGPNCENRPAAGKPESINMAEDDKNAQSIPAGMEDLGGGQLRTTFGGKLAGVNFNPSKDPEVDAAKGAMAQLADKVNAIDDTGDDFLKFAKQHALHDIQNAQMSIVKVLTYRRGA